MKIAKGPIGVLAGAAVIWLASTACVTHAQSLKSIQPQAVPESARPPAPKTEPQAAKAKSATNLDRPLGVNLKGIAFLAKPSQVNPGGLSYAKNAKLPSNALTISAVAVPALKDPGFKRQLNRLYYNVPLTLRVLGKLKKTVIAWYRSKGYPFVAVTVPPQEISSGIVQMVVVNARLGKVIVQDNKWFSKNQYRSAVRIKPNQHISLREVHEDVDWINRNPFRHASAIIRPGKDFGQSNLVIRTNERRPWRVYAGVDNYGTRISGRARYRFGANFGNLFGRGQQFSYQFTHSMKKNLSWAHSATYLIPLQSQRMLTFSASYSKDHPDLASPFNSEGTAWSVEAGYTIPWVSADGSLKEVSFRVPFKTTDNNLEFSQTPITNNETNIVQMEVSYNDQWSSAKRQWDFNVDLVVSPGGLTSRNKSHYFNVSRAGAKASYGILRVGSSFSTPLAKGFRWETNANAQLSTCNLLGSEQISMTGLAAVRGYPNSLVYADDGLVVRNDVLGPEIGGSTTGTFRPDIFIDAGIGSSVDKLPGEQSSVFLASVGFGLRYNLGSTISANLVYGRELSSQPVQVEHKSGELYMNLTVGY